MTDLLSGNIDVSSQDEFEERTVIAKSLTDQKFFSLRRKVKTGLFKNFVKFCSIRIQSNRSLAQVAWGSSIK